MELYPVFLKLTGRPCVVIGGGVVAERKVEGLVEAGASVKVISPALTARLQKLADGSTIVYDRRSYRAGDLEGYQLALVATDDPQITAAVFDEGRKRGVWVNAADDPAHCDFTLPSVLRRRELAVAVSTGGGSPALARSIREDLEGYFTAEYAALVELAADVRKELHRLALSPGYDAWRKALNGAARDHIRRGDGIQAKKALLQELGAMACE